MRGRAETVLAALKSDTSSLAFASDELLSDRAFIKGCCDVSCRLQGQKRRNVHIPGAES